VSLLQVPVRIVAQLARDYAMTRATCLSVYEQNNALPVSLCKFVNFHLAAGGPLQI
jgi:hypothetical protein